MNVACEQRASICLGTTKAQGTGNRLSPGPLRGAGEGNRTPVASLGSSCSAIELHPRARPDDTGRAGTAASASDPRASRRRSVAGDQPDRAGYAGSADAAVAAGVLGQVLLMVVLGVVEGRRAGDLGGDRPVAGPVEHGLVAVA